MSTLDYIILLQKIKYKNMKKLSVLFLMILGLIVAPSQAQEWEKVMDSKKGELNVYYYENAPYAYTAKNGKLAGIEIDIMNAFKEWLMEEKEIELKLNFTAYQEFDIFFNKIADGPSNSVGIGSVTIAEKREERVSFSAPYLKNVSVLITDGEIPTARNMDALTSLLSDLKPVTIKESIHKSHLDQLYKSTEVAPSEYIYVGDAEKILKKMKESSRYFGYVDIISFWKYLKNNKHYVKMHTIANKENEEFGFVFPKDSYWNSVVNEFFESGFGFTSTKAYHKILEKHLGFEIIEKVEID